jgi:hypothetical protein
MKLFQSKSVFYCSLSFLGLLILLCHSCEKPESGTAGAVDTAIKPIPQDQIETKRPEAKQPETKPAPQEQVEKTPEGESIVKAPADQPNIVAKIGEYIFTKEELQKRLMMKLRPAYGEYSKQDKPADAKTVLLDMIAEKAMVIDARSLNYLEDETIQKLLKRFRQRKLATLLLEARLQGKLTITEAEIDEKIKANPKLSRTQAQATVQRAKANKLLGQYYGELCKKLHVQKLSDNFSKAAQIHQRLLLYPKEPRRMKLIRINQVQNELTPEEKGIVLATYDNGKLTLKDWFDALCEIGPPSRPRDLHTPKGVERLLDRALRIPIFVAEAESLGLDKDENLLKQIKAQEDMRLLGKAMREKHNAVTDPNEKEIIAYFEKNKEVFGIQKALKIDQIWCQDLKTAQKVKGELTSGKDFEAVRKEYSLQKKASPFKAFERGEGMFFKDLWKGDPNEIVGPVKGFYLDGIKWRIVKILEKTPGKVKEYSSDMKSTVASNMREEQRTAIMQNYRTELLEKYSYEIYADRIKDINPLDIP